MPDFSISLAEIPIGISALYPSTKVFFEQYLSNEPPAFYVAVTPQDIAFERTQSALQDKKNGRPVRTFADCYLETLAVLRKVVDSAIAHDVILFHGSVVAVDGKAYLFAAPSGTGKTTHSGLWLDLLPNAHVLNGDKPFLKIKDGRVFACGTPWQGKEHLGCNEILPLEAICFLEQDQENSIEPLGFREALELLLRQIYLPKSGDEMLKVLRMCDEIGSGVRLYRLKCNRDPQAAVVSSSVMLARK